MVIQADYAKPTVSLLLRMQVKVSLNGLPGGWSDVSTTG